MIDESIYDLLKTVNSKCYPGSVEQEITPPFISHRQLGMVPSPTKDGSSHLDVIDYQVGAFAKTKSEVMTLASSIRTALDEHSSSTLKIRITGENDTYDEESQLYVVVQNYKIRLKR